MNESFKIERSDAEILEFIIEHNTNADSDEQVPLPIGGIEFLVRQSYTVIFKGYTANGDYGKWSLYFGNPEFDNPDDDVYFEVLTPASDPYAIDELKVGMVFTVLPAYLEWYQASMKQFGGVHVDDVVYLFKMYEDSCEFHDVGGSTRFIVPRADVLKLLRYALGSFVPSETRGYKW